MKRFTLFLLFTFTLCLSASAFAEFRAGAALRNITPDPLLPVSGGVGIPRPATEQAGDLFARALVMEQDGTRVAIVGVDNLGIPHQVLDRARAQIDGVPGEHVLIGVTHTHSAPDAYGFPDGRGGHTADLDYVAKMVDAIAAAVNDAVEQLQPAGLRIATGEFADRIAYNAYAENLFDPRGSVLQAVAADGAVIATLVNYAVHPEVLGANQGILSPDLCGPMYDRIEELVGGVAIFMNGAQGGMITADNRNPDGPGTIKTWEECIRIGHLLADEALRILEGAPTQENPPLDVVHREVDFPVDSELMRALVANSPIMEINEDFSVTTRLVLVGVGNAQMLTIPGEALPNIGAYLKRNMPTEHPFLLGLTNDAFGYILSKEDFGAFPRYDYISRTSLGERTGPILVEESLKLIESAP